MKKIISNPFYVYLEEWILVLDNSIICKWNFWRNFSFLFLFMFLKGESEEYTGSTKISCSAEREYFSGPQDNFRIWLSLGFSAKCYFFLPGWVYLMILVLNLNTGRLVETIICSGDSHNHSLILFSFVHCKKHSSRWHVRLGLVAAADVGGGRWEAVPAG